MRTPGFLCRSDFRRAAFNGVALLALAAVPLLSPEEAAAFGLLVPQDDRLPALRLAEQQVVVEIDDRAAVTHVTQVFENNTDQQLEATYYFAVPEGAATTEFALWMNGERIEGRVTGREEARAIYEGIVRRMQDPGLLEYVDQDLFQARIFPIPARGRQTVEIEYASVLQQVGTDLQYVYPLDESMGATIGEFEFEAAIMSPTPIQRVYSPRQDMEFDGGEQLRHAYWRTTAASTGEDIELYVNRGGDDVGASVLTWDPGDGSDGYFMLTLTPSEELAHLEVLPKQVTFVIDTSGSMAGVKMDQARDSLQQMIGQLRTEDTFNVISFSTGVRSVFDEPQPASRSNLNEALEWVSDLEAQGNTNISGALERAIEDPASEDRPHVILFLTDGVPTEGNTNIDTIIRSASSGVNGHDRRIFSFGLGYDVNTRLLDGMARAGRGESGYVRPDEEIGDIVGTFYASIGDPLLTALELEFAGVEVQQVHPSPMPDLYRDGQVTVFGRFEGGREATVRVVGRAGRERIELRHALDFTTGARGDRDFIGNLWATRRIDTLLGQIQQNGENADNVQEIMALATRWNIVTPYTSYLTTEPGYDASAPGMPDPSAQLRPMPRGRPAFADEEMEGELMRATGSNVVPTTPSPAQSGSAGGGRAAGAAWDNSSPGGASRAPVAAAAPRREARAEVGQAAVEDSIAWNERARSQTVTDSPVNVRSVAGRSFSIQQGVWTEAGTESLSVDVALTPFSDAYFRLLSENPELANIFALGTIVRFQLNGRVYEVRP
jgi:uncharacterized protein YegL